MSRSHSAFPWTHFTVTSPGVLHAFTVDKCEKCANDMQGANGVNLHEPKSKAIKLGMIEVKNPLPEGGWCDALDGVVCDHCYTEEVEGDV